MVWDKIQDILVGVIVLGAMVLLVVKSFFWKKDEGSKCSGCASSCSTCRDEK